MLEWIYQMLDTDVKFYAALSNPLRNLEDKVTDLEISSCLKCLFHMSVIRNHSCFL